MRLGQDVLSDLTAATAREWLIADGLGGAASGTASGAHSRRSHALLAAADADGALLVALLKLDERLSSGTESFDLGCNLVAAAPTASAPATDPTWCARPAGHRLLESFSADPWPTWRWRAGATTLEKSLFLVDGHRAVAVSYRHVEGPPARLSVSPLLVCRPLDALRAPAAGWGGVAQAVPGRVRVEATPGGTVLTLWHSGAFMPARVWQHDLVYPADREGAAPGPARRRPAAGMPATDTAFVPGYLECDLPVGGSFHIVASVEPHLFRTLAVEGRLGAPPPRTLGECVAVLAGARRDRTARWHRAAAAGAEVTACQAAIAHGADITARQAAIAHGGDGPARQAAAAHGGDGTASQAAIAHGGDGAALAQRPAPLLDAADPWLERLSQALADGLVRRDGRLTLLTRLPGGAERGSETLRALPALISLRAFEPASEVLRGYVEYLNEGLAPERFEAGGRPRYGDPAPALWLVHAAELLIRRSEDMDALRDPILPAVESIIQAYRSGTRHGIRVGSNGLLAAGEGDAACCRADVNALWFHALVATAQLARLAGHKERGAFYLAWAREHQARVLELLWDEKHGCLFEALTPSGPRPGCSPSQLLAVSLSPALLPAGSAARLLATLERDLLTPVGLRASAGAVTASPAWLGAYITAHLRVHQRSAEAQARAHGWLDALRARLDQRSAIHVPELIAAPRHGDAASRRRAGEPDESPAPASVLAAAELLRVWIEGLDHAATPAGVS